MIGVRVSLVCLLTLALVVSLSAAASAAPPSVGTGKTPTAPKMGAPASEAPGSDAPDAPNLLEKTGSALASAARAVGEKVGAAARAIGSGITMAWTALGDGLASLGRGIASLSSATASGIASAASALGSGLLSAARLAGSGLAAACNGLGGALSAIAAGLAAVGGLLAGLWGKLMAPVPVVARPYAIAGAATAGASLLSLAAWRLLKYFGGAAALYSRIARSDVLENEARSRLFDHIRDHPGQNVTELAEALGLGWGTTVYHLQRLKSTGLVAEKRGGNSKCFFVNGGTLAPAAQKAAAAMKHEKAQQIVTFLQGNPTASQKDMAAALGMSPALVSFHVKRLVEAGVLSKARTGKANALTLSADVAAAPIAA